jgi:hypothetical protein
MPWHCHRRADLRLAALVVYQSGQEFFPDCLLIWCESAIHPALCDPRQTMSESVLIACRDCVCYA